MLMHREKSRLLVIDLQEKLMPSINSADQLLKHCSWLINVAREMQIPTLVSEQYPKGLGHTLAPIKSLLPNDCIIMEKEYFSCVSDANCRSTLLNSARPQIILIGTEAHVCVLQTALELNEAGMQVYVVEECVGSRRATDKHLALERMLQAGISIVSREMVVFEWLSKAKTDEFRHICRTYIA